MSASKQASRNPDEGTPTTFDERLAELERIAAGLESGDLGLEQALEHYQQGVALLRSCRKELEGVRAQVQELSGEPGGPDQPLAIDPDGKS
ncbi:MAG: exodeoxyribonuclease VII small subunit [Planctomycetes bacterium]|nr:exodeoxyribonuclease VII small subunit [Planctomycetota bacterium]MCB9909155.1 exodeoxyribonuclease VII small subunit [Planctomycetota bacterium]HPF15291.1 exodeoxyribonuclease VII small subunit [Planctomycetota bacterium]HRV81194.1 exodeoxyribonuclease VII small subunit [Planctomycetota bacterium]